MKNSIYIIGASRIIDDVGDMSETVRLREQIDLKKLKVCEFKISSLTHDWNAPLPENHLKSACSPIEGLMKARQLLRDGHSDVVIIHGTDLLKTDFENRKEERQKLFQIYGSETLLTAFDRLVTAWRNKHDITKDQFKELTQHLFNNHLRTWKQKHPEAKISDQKWFNLISEHFRGVDCANPNTDFTGEIIVTKFQTARDLQIEEKDLVEVAGLGLSQKCEDGPQYIDQIIDYDHIDQSFNHACKEAQIDFRKLFLAHQAILEAYTCYPIVPLAFMLSTKLVNNFSEIPDLLEKYSITFTGGLNLAKAPGNNPTLSAMIEAVQIIRTGRTLIAGIHSNGALGYLQGFAIFRKG